MDAKWAVLLGFIVIPIALSILGVALFLGTAVYSGVTAPNTAAGQVSQEEITILSYFQMGLYVLDGIVLVTLFFIDKVMAGSFLANRVIFITIQLLTGFTLH